MYDRLTAMVTTYNQYTDSHMEISINHICTLTLDKKKITIGSVAAVEYRVKKILREHGLLDFVQYEESSGVKKVGEIHGRAIRPWY